MSTTIGSATVRSVRRHLTQRTAGRPGHEHAREQRRQHERMLNDQRRAGERQAVCAPIVARVACSGLARRR